MKYKYVTSISIQGENSNTFILDQVNISIDDKYTILSKNNNDRIECVVINKEWFIANGVQEISCHITLKRL